MIQFKPGALAENLPCYATLLYLYKFLLKAKGRKGETIAISLCSIIAQCM